MKTNHTKNESRLTCHQVHPECDVYHPDGHPIKNETPTPNAETVADKLTSVMFVEGYVEKENLEAVNFLLIQTLTDLQANAEREKREAVRVATIEAWNDAIELSDRLEESDTKFDEWRAFKGFRNGLRDRIRELVESPNTPD